MVASCLDQDPSKRPTADKLLKHPFFKNCKGTDFLVKNVLLGLPSVEKRYKESKVNEHDDDGGDDEDEDPSMQVKERRISGWNFNQDGLELDPVFPNDDAGAKEGEVGSVMRKMEEHVNVVGSEGGVKKKEKMLATLNVLKGSLEQELLEVKFLVNMIRGEEESDHHHDQTAAAAHHDHDQDHGEEKEISRLRVALENERKKNLQLELQLHTCKLQLSSPLNISN